MENPRSPDRRRLGPPMALGVFGAIAAWLVSCQGGTEGPGATSLDAPAEPDPVGEVPAFPLVDHVDQRNITDGRIAFEELFTLGDELFEAAFTALDGAGAERLPDGTPLPTRFSRVPPGGGRFTGPNGQACVACHNAPFPTSAGEAASNVAQDPARAGSPPFNLRNPTSLFGSAALQRLAEEMTEELRDALRAAEDAAVPGGAAVRRELVAKGVSFGAVTVSRALDGESIVDRSEVRGVDPDFVVRPYGWKGDVPTLRGFCRVAARNELGMEPDELVGKEGESDPDGDGVTGELSIGDITAITVYVGAQPVPTTVGALAAAGRGPAPDRATAAGIRRGEDLFVEIGCADCHVPELRLRDPVFREPSLAAAGAYFDGELDPAATLLDPSRPFEFHLQQEGEAPRFEPHPDGGLRIRLFGDLRRHFMGMQLADAQPTSVVTSDGRELIHDGSPVVVDPAVFLTAELWGVGNSGPWLHDGRAATLELAIRLHGVDAPPPVGDPLRSEAQDARDSFVALDDGDQRALVEFLQSLVHAKFEE